MSEVWIVLREVKSDTYTGATVDVKVHRISNGTSELLASACVVAIMHSSLRLPLCSDMHIVLVSTVHGHEMAFIEVGNFHYPLTPAIPCLRSLAGSYILRLQDDIFYGLSLPEYVHSPVLLSSLQ